LLADAASLTVRSDKRRFAPYGLFGGSAGTPSRNEINPDGPSARQLPVLATVPYRLRRGDVYRHVMASGGGYGNPLERDPQSVCRDVRLGKVSVEKAREAYAVEIVGDALTPSVDAEATAALRARRVSA
jgi:N-methylhydantoinase B